VCAACAQVHKLDAQYRAAKEALEQDIAAANAQVGCNDPGRGSCRDVWGAQGRLLVV
jgi:hypothetical protein